MRETWVRSLNREDPLEKEMATHSSMLAERIPWTEEPGWLQCMGSQSRTRLSNFTHSFERRKILIYWTDAPNNYIYSSLLLFFTPNLCYSPPFSIPDWVGSETEIEDLLWGPFVGKELYWVGESPGPLLSLTFWTCRIWSLTKWYIRSTVAHIISN